MKEAEAEAKIEPNVWEKLAAEMKKQTGKKPYRKVPYKVRF